MRVLHNVVHAAEFHALSLQDPLDAAHGKKGKGKAAKKSKAAD
jgi:hypothetical protein